MVKFFFVGRIKVNAMKSASRMSFEEININSN